MIVLRIFKTINDKMDWFLLKNMCHHKGAHSFYLVGTPLHVLTEKEIVINTILDIDQLT